MQKKVVLSPVKIKEGKTFAKLSGDNNKIHTDDLIGYNSLFGEKICHGVLIDTFPSFSNFLISERVC